MPFIRKLSRVIPDHSQVGSATELVPRLSHSRCRCCCYNLFRRRHGVVIDWNSKGRNTLLCYLLDEGNIPDKGIEWERARLRETVGPGRTAARSIWTGMSRCAPPFHCLPPAPLFLLLLFSTGGALDVVDQASRLFCSKVTAGGIN